MRLIDADALLEAMNTWDKFGFTHTGAFVREPGTDDYVPYVHYDDMVKCVKGMPTADAVDLEKITEAHEKIGYEKGYRDGYAEAIEDEECRWRR